MKHILNVKSILSGTCEELSNDDIYLNYVFHYYKVVLNSFIIISIMQLTINHSVHLHRFLTFVSFLDKSEITHKKEPINPIAEIYKTINNCNPAFMWVFFVKKDVLYNLRKDPLGGFSALRNTFLIT